MSATAKMPLVHTRMAAADAAAAIENPVLRVVAMIQTIKEHLDAIATISELKAYAQELGDSAGALADQAAGPIEAAKLRVRPEAVSKEEQPHLGDASNPEPIVPKR